MRSKLVFVTLLLLPNLAFAGGFESGENTAVANARGGTGVVSSTDSTALYFNPSLLAKSEGFHLTIDANFLNQNLTFNRNPLVTKLGTTTFDEIQNEKSFFPLPFLAASYDFNTDYFAMGLSVFGPHSYGNSCLTELVDGKCVSEDENAARHMLIGADLAIIYALLGAAVAIEAPGGSFFVGAGGGVAYQQITEMDLVVDQVYGSIGSPYNENPGFGGRMEIRDVTDLKPAYNFGLSYISDNGFRIGFSGRPSIDWNPDGQFEIQLPASIREFVTFSSNEMSIELKQAGSYRLGLGWFGGQHPTDLSKHRYDFEFNFVYEDWGKLDTFKATPDGDLILFEETRLPLNPVFQGKSYQDTFSMRVGGSYAISSLFTVHAGGFIETAAQTKAYTNADFVSWERYSGSLGLVYNVTHFLDLTLSYSHIFSPDRTVTNGEIYQQIPLSECTGPNYTAPACSKSGTPPGTPQNEGQWTTSSQVIGAGIKVHFK